MIYERPYYYDKFHCIAGDCPMTCCAGWEVDVDCASREYFLSLEGPLGDELRATMQPAPEDEDMAVFPLTDEGNCPFLDDQGLCRLYSAYGEEGFCQTCSEYPRYFGVTGSHQQIDLTLSCPEAVRIFFADTTPITFSVSEDIMEGEELTDEEEMQLLDLYQWRDALMRKLTAFRGTTSELLQLLCQQTELKDCPCDLKDIGELYRLLSSTEELDGRWRDALNKISRLPDGETAFSPMDQEPNAICLRLCQYLLFRYSIDIFYGSSREDILRLMIRSLMTILLIYHSGWEASDAHSCRAIWERGASDTALPSPEMIRLMDATLLFSRQIEHSEDNVELLKAL